MAVTEKKETGTGSLNSFPFQFKYLKREDVKASLNDTLIDPTKYEFSNATTIAFKAIDVATELQETSGAPKDGVAVRIFRQTDVDDPVATFFSGSSIRAQDLNDNFLQVVYRSQEDENNNWNNNTETIKSDETWASNDTTIATTAAVDARFQDEAEETIRSDEAWVSDDDKVATTAAIDARFFNDTTETIESGEEWVSNNTSIATTGAIDARIDTALTSDIAGTNGVSITNDGDGTITVGLTEGAVDLDRIKAGDISASGEDWPNDDNTIATTAKIDDMIDAAITGDIATNNTGITVTDDGDGTITLGLADIDLDRIKAEDIVTLAEQDAGPTADDDSIFTTSAAAKRFDTIVQTDTPAGSDWEAGKTWLQNDDNQTLKIWSGSAWLDVASGGSFRTQDKVIYVDATGGDDNKSGHRISGPKLTIKEAVADINADISLSTEDSDGFEGGTQYVEGNYAGVSLIHHSGTGIGTGVTADISVNSSGVVTTVTINNATALQDYSIGDVLTAADADLGDSGNGSGLEIPIIGGGDGMTVIVAAGVYQEVAPIKIKRRNVSIIGMALRSTIVHPTVASQGDHANGNHALFELNSGSFIQNLTLTGMKANNSGSNTLDSALPIRQGWNFAFLDGCFIVKSPYIQNCTNFSDSEIDNSDLRAHRPRGGAAGDTDSLPTGGGMLVNGSAPATTSPLRSMVADSYTHVGLNGPGILVTNNGYAQCTSSYAFFNKYHIKALNGGQANLAASTTDFGERALMADGKSPTAIFTSAVNGAVALGDDPVISFDVDAPTASGTWFGTAQRPASNMLVEVTNSDSSTSIYPILSAVSDGGTGWTVTISRPDSNERSTNLGLEKALDDDAAVSFFLRSQIASSGHTMEFVGSGTNYNALPENGGVPDETKQIFEDNDGKIWTATTDHNGKFKIGGNQTDDPFFEVDQQLGLVTIPEGSIAFNLVSDKTPQLGGNLDVNTNTITGLPDAPTENSHAASKKYVDDQIAGLDTDLSYTANTRVLASSTGDNVTLPEVVASGNSGLMTGADKNKLDNVATSANNYSHPNHGNGGGGDATSNGDGDITIRDDAVTYAKMQDTVTNNRVLGAATAGEIGEVQVATAMIEDDAVTSAKLEHDITLPGTGAVIVPTGITDDRPDPATNGMIRYNSTTNQFEGRINGAWGGIGGGATGGGSDAVFIENGQNVTTDYSIPANTNAGSFGPITIDSGATVTVPASSNWTIV